MVLMQYFGRVIHSVLFPNGGLSKHEFAMMPKSHFGDIARQVKRMFEATPNAKSFGQTILRSAVIKEKINAFRACDLSGIAKPPQISQSDFEDILVAIGSSIEHDSLLDLLHYDSVDVEDNVGHGEAETATTNSLPPRMLRAQYNGKRTTILGSVVEDRRQRRISYADSNFLMAPSTFKSEEEVKEEAEKISREWAAIALEGIIKSECEGVDFDITEEGLSGSGSDEETVCEYGTYLCSIAEEDETEF